MALVTGASSGLGAHFARVLASAGATVVAAARRADKLARLVGEIQQTGGTASAVALDVTDSASVAALAQRLDGVAIDVLINNAGVGARAQITYFANTGCKNGSALSTRKTAYLK